MYILNKSFKINTIKKWLKETDKSTIIVGDFKDPLSVTGGHRLSRQKKSIRIHKTWTLANNMTQNTPLTTAQSILFSCVHATISKTDYVLLAHKTNLKIFKITLIQNKFLDHNEIKLETSNREISRKKCKYLEIKHFSITQQLK